MLSNHPVREVIMSSDFLEPCSSVVYQFWPLLQFLKLVVVHWLYLVECLFSVLRLLFFSWPRFCTQRFVGRLYQTHLAGCEFPGGGHSSRALSPPSYRTQTFSQFPLLSFFE